MVTYDGLKIADCGFFINLKKDEDRLSHILNVLKTNLIEGVERFDAYYKKGSGTSRNGSFISHTKLIEEFDKTQLESCLILEDDIEFTEFLTTENITFIAEKLKDNNIDAIWLGGCPRTVFKESENFSYVFEKSCAFGIIIKKSFSSKLKYFLKMNKRVGSADSFYNRMIYGNIENANTITEIINNKNRINHEVYDLLYTKQIIYSKPILVESNSLYSNNTTVRVLNGERKSSKQYIKGFLYKTSSAKDINEIDKIKINNL